MKVALFLQQAWEGEEKQKKNPVIFIPFFNIVLFSTQSLLVFTAFEREYKEQKR